MNAQETITSLTSRGAALSVTGSELRIQVGKGIMTPELNEEIKKHKEEIISIIGNACRYIYPAPKQDFYRLSSAQKRLLLVYELDKSSLAYNDPRAFEIKEPVDTRRLEAAFRQLIRRHEILRTSFAWTGEGPVQQIAPDAELGIESFPAADELSGTLNGFIRPFDLSRPPLLRVGWQEKPSGGSFLLLDIHHIVTDGLSQRILINDFLSIYKGEALPEPTLHYKDFAEWQHGEAQKEEEKRQKAFWLTEYSAKPPLLDLPADFPRPATKAYVGGTAQFTFDTKTTEGLKIIANAANTTLFTVLHALFNIFLSRLSGQEDVVIGTVTAGRRHADLENIPGTFINILPVRNFPEADMPFLQFLAAVRARLLACFEHQTFPFEDLVDELHPERDAGRNPLFDVLFLYQTHTGAQLSIPGLTLIPYPCRTATAKFDLTLSVMEEEGSLQFELEYAAALFKAATVHRFTGYFSKIATAVISDPNRTIGAIDILPEEEKLLLLRRFSETATSIPQQATIVSRFEGTVRLMDLAAAITFEGKTLSYRQLNTAANDLARRLLARDLPSQAIAGIMLPRSAEMLIAIFGILKAGYAYLPLDPEYPADRIADIAGDSGMAILLTTPELQPLYAGLSTPVEYILPADNHQEPDGSKNPTPGPNPSDVAYVIYTSGSTGKPKGVTIEHRNVINFVDAITAGIDMHDHGAILCLTTISFDIFVLETILPLLRGMRIVLAGAAAVRDPAALTRLIREERVDYMQITPSHLKLLLSGSTAGDFLKGVRTIMVGGEAFPLPLFQEIKRRYKGKIYNMYGPTETTVWSTVADLTDAGTVDIGKPIANTCIRILGNRLGLQPVGVPGELYIGGAGVARGYHRRQELTKEKFIPDPYFPEGRLYRTGDLARWLPDGSLEYLGRIDNQVKVRGFRIELGEIESQLAAFPQEAAVAVKEFDGDTFLVAYYVAPQEIDLSALRRFLAARLPAYMVPSFYVRLDSLPLTPNGKLDRNALPAPAVRTSIDQTPGSTEEKLLAAIWSAVLKLDGIGIDDNFFSAGGDSVKAVQIGSRIRTLGYEISMKDIFACQTIRELAHNLSTQPAIASPSQPATGLQTPAIRPAFIALPEPTFAGLPDRYDAEAIYPLSPMQEGMLFDSLLHAGTENYFEQRSFVIAGDLNPTLVEKTLDELTARHAVLRTAFVHDTGDKPVQIVLRQRKAGFTYQDLREKAATTPKDELIRSLTRIDRQQPFDLEKEALMRLTMLRTGPEEHLLIWSFHHILMDGWCIGIVIRDFQTLYTANHKGIKQLLPPPAPYSTYIGWLATLDHEASIRYWRQYLASYARPAGLPQTSAGPEQTLSYTRSSHKILLDPTRTKDLQTLAATHGVTLNTVLQTAWGIVLSKYNDCTDVIFGATVSGRPMEIAGIESMVGLFINTVPVRIDYSPEDTLAGLLQRTQGKAIENTRHHYQSLAEIQKLSAWGRNLFDHIIVFENFPIGAGAEDWDGFIVTDSQSHNQNNYNLWIAVDPGDDIGISFEYNAARFDAATIVQASEHLEQVLRLLCQDAMQKVAELEILTENERHRLAEFNCTAYLPGEDEDILELFARQVTRTPDNTAVVYGGNRMTYNELDILSSELARSILSQDGPGKIVALYTEPSLEMITGIWGILKAGAAFLPLDPKQHPVRTSMILQESRCRILVTREQPPDSLSFTGKILVAPGKYTPPATRPEHPLPLPDKTAPAYLIFTSGSTGKPKGVTISRSNLYNYVRWFITSFRLTPCDRSILTSSFAFDLGYSSLFPTLLAGGELHLAPVSLYQSPDELLAYIETNGITYLKLTPSLFSTLAGTPGFAGNSLEAMRYVLLGGESIKLNDLRKAEAVHPHIRYVNHYGPTETTIGAVACPIGDLDAFTRNPAIGRPIHNTRAYILDRFHRLLPPGVPGELCIGGAGVGRGYLDREELTREKFMATPLDPQGRVYRTGDLARWLPNGDIQFLGRIDHQVKIRGYRIEPAEIEFHLAGYQGIGEVTVQAREKDDTRFLVAYYTSSQPVDDHSLRQYLEARLPDYMVPAHLLRIEQLPLTPNGKIDFGALLDPTAIPVGDRIPPNGEIEEKLLDIWSKVLHTDTIGVTDNFFSIGGDSIKSIQISTRMRIAGYKLSVNDIFANPTIRELAQQVTRITVPRNQDNATGSGCLTPIQRAFFASPGSDKHHYNQSVMLAFPGKIGAKRMKNIFAKLQEHHDALRIVFTVDPEGRRRMQPDMSRPVSLEEFDLHPEADPASVIAACCNDIQAGMDLEKGPLIKLGLFHLQGESRLLIAIHHLVVDGVSWRILFEDIEILYRQASHFLPLSLPARTDSFLTWSAWLRQYENSEVFRKAAAYWQEFSLPPAGALPRDNPEGRHFAADAALVSFTLDSRLTSKLLGEAHTPFRTRINDLLLAALMHSLHRRFGLQSIVIDLEGHGRNELPSAIPVDTQEGKEPQPAPDISRTIGWFTTIYPVLLKTENDDPVTLIRLTKETLRNIPNQGFDYLPHQYPQDQKTPGNPAAIRFNYLGRFDSDLGDKSFTLVAPAPKGAEVAASLPFPQDWTINGLIAGKELELTLSYSRDQYAAGTVTGFMEAFHDSLTTIIECCCAFPGAAPTPSDFTYPLLTLSQLDILQASHAIEDICPLSPLQEGMLFHAMLDPGADPYFEQKVLTVKGKLDVALVKESLDKLAARYGILRTIFPDIPGERPLQAILREQQLDFTYADLQEQTTPDNRRDLITAWRLNERSRAFDMRKGPLFRLSILRVAPAEYEFIWCHHHILMDGWCMGIIISEFNRIYTGLTRGEQVLLAPAKPYSAYLKWLEKRDREEALRFWRSCLSGYESTASLPRRTSQRNDKPPDEPRSFCLTLDQHQVQRLRALSATHSVTMNTLLQAAWGVVLSRYNNSEDVVFGSVVSGRPPEVDGIETMVGLFANTIPVRIAYGKGDTIASLLRKMHTAAQQRDAYQYGSLAEIQSVTELGRDLLDHILVFENYPVAHLILEAGAAVEQHAFEITGVQVFEQTSYDLTLMILPGTTIDILFHFNARTYDEEIIRAAAAHLNRVIGWMITDADTPLSEIDILTEPEKRQIKSKFNATDARFPETETILSLFEKQAEKTPGNVALRCEEKTLTYHDLAVQMTAMAAGILQTADIGPGDLAGIMLEREEDLIPAVFAILKTGAAYVPIDPHYPPERIRAILTDTGMKVIITRGKYLPALTPPASPGGTEPRPGPETSIFNLDLPREHFTIPAACRAAPDSRDPAYVIFTSGSTGKPKGVIIEHRSVVNRIHWMQRNYPLNETDVLLQKTPIVFDVSVWELFWWAFTGASLCILRTAGEKDPAELVAAIARYRVTTIHFVPSMLSVFLSSLDKTPNRLASLRRVFASGEALTPEQVQTFGRTLHQANGTRLINLYGPTEATVDVSAYECSFLEDRSVPIGKPIDNIRLYILDKASRLCPIGVPGELCIAGVGLARGYLNNPALTAEKFSVGSRLPENRIYRTGDLAKWLPDGNIDYLGRLDHQVKIRGFRIELGDIEHHLVTFPGIQTAIAAVNENGEDKNLVAYYIAAEEINPDTLMNHLATTLPDYMIPRHYVRLDRFPLTSNGKLNRRALPNPIRQLREAGALLAGETETRLAAVWAELLGIDAHTIRPDDDFFRLGGHSIKAIRLTGRIANTFSLEIPLRVIFDNPTLQQLAARIHSTPTHTFSPIPRAADSTGYPATAAQEKLFFEFLRDRNTLVYNISAAFEIRGPLEPERLQQAFHQLVTRHESLRTTFRLTETGVLQEIRDQADAIITHIDAGPGNGVPQAFRRFLQPFDLTRDLLIRVGVLQTGDGKIFLFVDIHHIACDGISLNILIRDFKRLYHGLNLPAPELRYVDYAVWQKKAQDAFLDQRQYWTNRLAGDLPDLDLPVQQNRESTAAYRADIITLTLHEEITRDITRANAASNVSDFMFLLSIFSILLSKLSGHTDIVIATDLAGRTHPNLKDITGTFVNILPLRLQVGPRLSFREHLAAVRQCVLEAFENQDFQVDQLFPVLDEKGKPRRNKLSAVHFSMANFFDEDTENPEIEFLPVEVRGNKPIQYEFKLEVERTGGRLHIHFIFSKELYDRETIQTLTGYYHNILATVLEDDTISLARIALNYKTNPHVRHMRLSHL
jgi:amino acid adenylation domain-containing protein/non-ribosomal peptide synthase protein (TIGR01720 family)